MRTHLCRLFILSTMVSGLASADALSEDGVTKDRIVFGQVAALQGPAQALGQGMREGILAAFEEVESRRRDPWPQARTEIRRRRLRARKDNRGNQKILAEDKVFALVGPVGTPTSKAGQPIATEAKVPFIGPFTGAEFLRNPYNRYVVNIRSSYFQETEAWIEHLTKDLGITKIAILYQDDTFGLAGLEGVKIAMAKRKMSLVASGTFKRNTIAVKSALLEIMKAEPAGRRDGGPL